jgi:hypoxanthine phosphoribosyltransferase
MANQQILVNKEQIDKLIKGLAQKINKNFKDQIGKNECKGVVLVGLLTGAAYCMTDLSRALEDLGFNHEIDYIRTSSYIGQERQKEVKIDCSINPEKLKGKIVILVDELYDSGHSLAVAYEYFKKHFKTYSLYTCVVFRKQLPEDHGYAVPDYLGCMLPNLWLYGYGMDNEGLDRGKKDVWVNLPNDFNMKTFEELKLNIEVTAIYEQFNF